MKRKRVGGELDTLLERLVLDLRREHKLLLRRQARLEAFVSSNMPRRRRGVLEK